MARMYPAEVPANTTSAAERLLYREFARQLPDDYIVMHGVKWLTRHRRYERFDREGEADFVILHPRRGILVVEVKGGGIAGEWAADSWTSTDGYGVTHPIKNPFTQVDNAFWQLRAKLEEHPATLGYTYPRFKGVAFPDIVVGPATFGIGWDRSLVLDSTDLRDLGRAIERMYGAEPPNMPLPKAAIDAVVDTLRPTIVLTRPGLAAAVATGEAEILRLSREQARVLDLLRNQRRAVIDGCAGSGKTVLAVEKAIQLASEGFSVLLTCFNKALAEWMRAVVAQQGGETAARIRVSHYHDLAVRLCEEAGHPTTIRPGDQQYWDNDLPDDLMAAIPDLPARFDAIVVDEGQDFRDNWWVTIEELLTDPGDGVFYIFQDQHQAIYQRTSDLPITTPPFLLNDNYRSSGAIHQRVVRYFDGQPKPRSIGPAGQPVEDVVASGKGAVEDVRRVVARLLDEEGLAPAQVVVLSAHGKDRSALREGERAGTAHLTWSSTPGPREVRVSSIHGFKGLESDVVVLAETESLARNPRWERLCYVALSRAKHHLVVIGGLPAAD